MKHEEFSITLKNTYPQGCLFQAYRDSDGNFYLFETKSVTMSEFHRLIGDTDPEIIELQDDTEN